MEFYIKQKVLLCWRLSILFWTNEVDSTSWQGFIYDSVFGLLDWSSDSKFKVKIVRMRKRRPPTWYRRPQILLDPRLVCKSKLWTESPQNQLREENHQNLVSLGSHFGEGVPSTVRTGGRQENKDEFLDCEHTGPTDIPPKSRDQSTTVTRTDSDVDSDADGKF